MAQGTLVSLARTMLSIASVLFVTEFTIMWIVFALSGVSVSTRVIVTDAGLLALITAPPIYWLVKRSVERQQKLRRRAERRAAKLTRLAITDPLTRTLNRRGITIALKQAMAHAERYGHPLSVALADIDRFKEVNDAFGHEAGDRALEGVASILSEAVRLPDQVGRYGGEEFLLLFPETDLEASTRIAERIRDLIGDADLPVGHRRNASLTVSIGVTAHRNGESASSLISRVDGALYDAKRAGRNRVVIR